MLIRPQIDLIENKNETVIEMEFLCFLPKMRLKEERERGDANSLANAANSIDHEFAKKGEQTN